MQKISNYIDGEFRAPRSGEYLENLEPATGAAYSLVPASDELDIDDAVDAAKRAFPGWARTPAAERSRILLDIAARIDARHEELARAESIDTGKPISLARSLDIPRAASNFRFFATAILHASSETQATDDVALNFTLRQPRGVAALISPWNLPLYLFSWKVAPALATGNSAVGKPSELTPMTAHLLAEICRDAGLPAGVLNIVHGTGARAGAALAAHPRVPMISFTGGTATGAQIARSAAPLFKKLSLELGGKNPNIVFADADFEEAVASAARAAFLNQGEICLCGSRILVERPLHDRFVERLVAAAKRLTIGDPLEEKTDQGALISKSHFDKVSGFVALARTEGGAIRCGGAAPPPVSKRCRGGYFFEPTVITGLGPECRVNQEEIFGPVVSVIPFDGEEEAIAIANGTRYGLAATLWTTDLARAHRVASRIDAGTVWINCWMLRDLRAPFGGMKESGIGREGGDEALRFFTEPKNVCIRISQGAGGGPPRGKERQ
ncbi:MAG: aldehyde dehydrogenase [Planctomycetes bacterium]|nr:aldehyde dehydrogenase [Planctomycetota bacterium]